MNRLLSHFVLRLMVPLLGLLVLIAAGEPLPSVETHPSVPTITEIEPVGAESQAVTPQARVTAAAIRVLLTVPALTGARCARVSCPAG